MGCYKMSDELKLNDGFVDASILDDDVPVAPTPTKETVDTFTSGINYGDANPTPAPAPQPVYSQPTGTKLEEPVSIGTWIGIMLLGMIPCVNVVMLFVWAFSDGKESRKNWAKAALIVAAIGIGLYIICIAAFGAALSSALSSLY